MRVCGGLYVGDPDTQVHVYLHHVLELGVCVCVGVLACFSHTKTHTHTDIHACRFFCSLPNNGLARIAVKRKKSKNLRYR
ncbi:hypothetical protein COCCADRAFT_104356 [Bipolaris zeicola 26-R-13]|uniref:Uncharacterized protein n=1 Tax=Cochliobolus carbonum (strain 26-R-13) TaxID=930089 RepID=W6Y572_COCC2|nr:uncharacterized protein COCCADRAFT_104356 [Bipolaris zeicola 26-R-13]EUC30239.1 hypothetical protein COCCADRAFT_104356 [Bipolaris zeicola 26-R-13]